MCAKSLIGSSKRKKRRRINFLNKKWSIKFYPYIHKQQQILCSARPQRKLSSSYHPAEPHHHIDTIPKNIPKWQKKWKKGCQYISGTFSLISPPPLLRGHRNFPPSSAVERKTNSKQELFRKHIFLALTPHPKWVFLKPGKGVAAVKEEEKKPQHYFHVSLNNIAVHNQNQFHFLWVKKENHWENKKNISTSLRKLWKCAKKAHQRFRS